MVFLELAADGGSGIGHFRFWRHQYLKIMLAASLKIEDSDIFVSKIELRNDDF